MIGADETVYVALAFAAYGVLGMMVYFNERKR